MNWIQIIVMLSGLPRRSLGEGGSETSLFASGPPLDQMIRDSSLRSE